MIRGSHGATPDRPSGRPAGDLGAVDSTAPTERFR